MTTAEQNRKGYVNAEDIIKIGPYPVEQCEPAPSSILSAQGILYSGIDISKYENASRQMIKDELARICQ